MASREEPLDSFRAFLTDFSQTHSGPLTEDDSLPLRLVTYYVNEDDLEGECLDWVLQYFGNKCPFVLGPLIARAALDELLTTDLSQYHAYREGDSDVILYEAGKLARGMFSCVYAVCERWSHELPPLDIPDRLNEISVHSIKNTRRKMEDRHVILPDLNGLFKTKNPHQLSYYAVFDGHGGLDASSYAAAHVHCNTVSQECLNRGIAEALKEGYKLTDSNFVSKAEREQLRSGSTGVSIIIRDDVLHVAWLGDSQAILVRNGRPVQLMDPHKPEREDEKKRIEALGGCVVFFGAWRVNGTLSVSRAIGDAEHKPYVSGEPDVNTFKLTGEEDYIVLACDGLWDTVSPKDLVKIVYDYVQENDRLTVAQKLVQSARQEGSGDNITVIVVYLRKEIAPPSESCDVKQAENVEDNSMDKDSRKDKNDDNKCVDNKKNSTKDDKTNDSAENLDSNEADNAGANDNEIDTQTFKNSELQIDLTNQDESYCALQDSAPSQLLSVRSSPMQSIGGKKNASHIKKNRLARTKKTIVASKSMVANQSKIPNNGTGICGNKLVPSPRNGKSQSQNHGAKQEEPTMKLPPTSRNLADPDLPNFNKNDKTSKNNAVERSQTISSLNVKTRPRTLVFGSESEAKYVQQTTSLPISLKPKKSPVRKTVSLPPVYSKVSTHNNNDKTQSHFPLSNGNLC